MSDPFCLISESGLQRMAPSADGEGVHWTADPTVELPIKLDESCEVGSMKPITIMDVLQNAVSTFGDRIALRVERGGNDKWKEWTFRAYYNECKAFAKSLISIGFQPFDVVNIIGFNSPEWVIADVGTIVAGGIAAGIYTTNGPEACHYISSHSKAKVIVVEDAQQAEKFIQLKDRLPELVAIVQWSGKLEASLPFLYTWSSFLSLGMTISEDKIDERINSQKPGNCCTLIYTSGTTGNPKAVMLSHDNITWTARVLATSFNLSGQNERIVSFLPLSHIAAQMNDIHAVMLVGATASFARPDVLKGSLVETLNSVRPTIFFGVPRVWEKIEEKMRSVGAANTGLKKTIGDWAKQIGLSSNYAKLNDQQGPWGYTLANTMVFRNVQKALGLDECAVRVTGAAPITISTVEYFMSLDMPLAELYGMSETSGPHTLNLPGATKIGSVGRTMSGCETKINNPIKSGKNAGEGEICMRGRHIMMGYMYNATATRDNIDSDGFLHSGDLGKVDSNGFLSITGRIKELIITAGGENIPPVLIEDSIKAELPIVSNVMVIGDKRKFLSCLLTLKTEPDEKTGNPSDTLTSDVIAFCSSIGSNSRNVHDAVMDKTLLAALQNGINKANEKSTSRAQRVQSFRLLTKDFSIAGDELTPTMKLKRRVVSAKYEDVIESMYEDVTSIKSKL